MTERQASYPAAAPAALFAIDLDASSPPEDLDVVADLIASTFGDNVVTAQLTDRRIAVFSPLAERSAAVSRAHDASRLITGAGVMATFAVSHLEALADPAELLELAETALLSGKHSGGGRFIVAV